MKPEILSVKNIGPFIGSHTIDFTLLDSIFLVCGKTGAGKTTIFDAISYIFYSKPQGSRSQIVRSLRSHFADEKETAEAELIFTIASSKYKIMRRLPFLKPGNKHEKPEEVELSEWINNEWKDLTSTNKSETDKKILDIIKLNEKEFSRIILLPQGEFAEFLKENSNQKKETLAELFPISKYTEIMQVIKEKEKEERIKIKHIQTQIENLDKEFDFNLYETQKKEFEDEIILIKKNYNKILETIKLKTAEFEQAKILNKKNIEYLNIIKKIEAMDIHYKEIEKLKEKIEKAYKAASLSAQADSVNKLMVSINEYKIDIEKKIKDLNFVVKDLENLQDGKQEIEEEKIKSELLKKNLDILERLAVINKEIDDKKNELQNILIHKKQMEAVLKKNEDQENIILKKIKELQNVVMELDVRKENMDNAGNALNYFKRLIEMVQKKENAVKLYNKHSKAAENNKYELETCIKNISIEEELLNNLQKEKNIAEVNEKSAAIAVCLKENEPCPVCGSTHHPNPAVFGEHSIFSISDKIQKCEHSIKNFLNSKELLDKSYTERIKDKERYSAEIKEADKNFELLNNEFCKFEFILNYFPQEEEVKELISVYSQKMETATALFKQSQVSAGLKLNAENNLNDIRQEKNTVQTKFTDLRIKENSIKTILEEKDSQYAAGFLQLHESIKADDTDEMLEHCKELILASVRKINGYEERLSENKLKHSQLETAIIQKREQLNKWEKSLQTESKILNEELNKKGFASICELQNSIIDEAMLTDFQNEVREFTEENIALKQTAAGLITELEGKEIINPDIIEDEIKTFEKKQEEENDRLSELTGKLTNINSLYDKKKQLNDEIILTAANAELIHSLSNDLNGENKLKLKFDIWVLSTFLREITVYANSRLERMSSGRYVLKVSNSTLGNNLSGLDLEIYDAYTGTVRPTASLSGGETFMVSISLALGLADSIQTGNGGIKLDSMFIDEGFGSLDEASLENAISILDEVRGNRMVGIISHVSELKTRIPKKIEVEKTSHGSHIKQN